MTQSSSQRSSFDRTIPLSETTTFIVDNRGKTAPTAESGIALIATNCVTNDNLYPQFTNVRYVSQETYDKWFRAHPEPGDIILTNKGSKNGAICLVPDPVNFVIAQDMVALRANEDVIDSFFLFAVLRSPDVQKQIKNLDVSGVIPHFKKTDFDKLHLPYPDMASQRIIGRIYYDFCAKIELNRRMNGVLEGMARAIFKAWFIDFEPVKAKAAGATRFPGMPQPVFDQLPNQLVHSELGEIPEGWEIHSLPEIATFREGPGILAKDFREDGIPLVRLAGLKSGVSLLDGCNYLDPDKVEKKWSHFRLSKGDILLSTSASLGRVAEVTDEAVGAIPYTGIIGFRAKAAKSVQRYIRHFLTSPLFQVQVQAMGAGSVLRHFGPTHLKSMNILIPPLMMQQEFSDVVMPMDKADAHFLQEATTLAAIRDTLLPKLISGELRVSEAVE